MERKPDLWTQQFKEICKIAGINWAAWLLHANNQWAVGPRFSLSKTRFTDLNQLIKEPQVSEWLAGALGSGRARWRNAENHALGCQRIYLFPNVHDRQLLIVGSDPLEKTIMGFLKLLALYPQSDERLELSIGETKKASTIQRIRAELESSYNPQVILDKSLEYLANQVAGDAAFLAIRAGNVLQIQSTWQCSQSLKNAELSLSQSQPLNDIIRTRMGVILGASDLQQIRSLPKITEKHLHAWMGVPILISQRVVGIVAFVSSSRARFTDELLQQITLQVNQLAYPIENAIIFSEAARYLEQMALLNELAGTASSSIELNEASRRMMHRLRRAFDVDWAAVFLLIPEANLIKEYGGSGRSISPREIAIKGSLIGYAITSGLPLRVNDLSHETQFMPTEPGDGSELAVPLKYRGNIIGAIDLVSKQPNAFSSQDEQLLSLISGHLAGLFENMRLNQETQERAQKLQDTVLELRAMRETALDITSALELDNLLERIAHRARVLVDARGAELSLVEEKDQCVKTVVSVTPWESQQGLQVPFLAGIAGRMAVLGEPLIIDDYNAWSGRLTPEKIAPFKAAAGVPLVFKGQVIGSLIVKDNRENKKFTPEDVRLLQLLAPHAAISIRNAQLYQEQQELIAAQRLAESNLVRSARLAAVGEMAAGVAHELNNPLTTVTGFVELVLNDLPLDSPSRSDLELVLQESLRAREVVRRLLDFSRPTEFHRVRTDLRELVDQVLSLVNHLIRTNGIQLVVEHYPDLPWVSVDPNQIQQVLLNLTHNALQASSSGGTLSIQTGLENRDGSEWVILRVKDTGEGISPENLERIFQPFFTTRPQNKGTGLGLSVSYGIIQSHNGFIEVESQVGVGSIFSVFLPVQSDLEGN